MKRLLVLCLLFSGATSKKLPLAFQKLWGELAGDFQADCAAENNLNVEVTRSIIKLEAPDTRPMHCYAKCVLEKMKFLTPDGDIDKSVAVDTVHFFTNEIIDGCVVKEEDRCKKAYLLALCGLNAIAVD